MFCETGKSHCIKVTGDILSIQECPGILAMMWESSHI